MTADYGVIFAAEAKGYVPADVLAANEAFGQMNFLAGGTEYVGDWKPPAGWESALAEWRLTPDYARACQAAFESQ